jgi:hypothetical protein
VYQLTEEEQVTSEVKVYSPDRPRKSRTFHTSRGRRRHKLVSSHRIRKEIITMAATKTRTRKTRKDPELDGLEELEELEELELDEEDEKPKRTRKSRKAAPDPDPDDDDEDEDDDEDDESEFASMTLRQLRVAAKEAGIKSRGLDKDELIAALEDADEEGEDEDEDDEPAPRTRKRTKAAPAKAAKGKGTTKRTPPPPRELPKGKVGVERVAELAKTDGRTVRVFLRSEGVEKVEGRYAFTEKQAATLARKIGKK